MSSDEDEEAEKKGEGGEGADKYPFGVTKTKQYITLVLDFLS